MLCFQDLFEAHCAQQKGEHHRQDGEGDASIANVFFDLANAPEIMYRVPSCHNQKVIIQQDTSACTHHTGGIVWETAYLLLNYLLTKYHHPKSREQQNHHRPSLQSVVEVGAGCGLVSLGLHLAQVANDVVATECREVLPNLTRNIRQNVNKNIDPEQNVTDDCGDDVKRCSSSETTNRRKNGSRIHVVPLDWTCYVADCQAAMSSSTSTTDAPSDRTSRPPKEEPCPLLPPHSVDLVIGTDVVFTPPLVEPLLQTIRYLAHDQTTILLCLQERCPDSYRLLLERAQRYEMEIRDISNEVYEDERYQAACGWGREMECCLLQMKVVAKKIAEKATKKKKAKEGRSGDDTHPSPDKPQRKKKRRTKADARTIR